VVSFDQFTKQGIPRWASNDAITQAAYDEYVEKVCPCVLVVHSQAGNFAFNAALKNPSKIKALVVVEPSGSPDPDKTDLSPLRQVPILWVWGDFISEQPFWVTIQEKQERFRAALQRAGGAGDLINLPAQGIKGNSHMLMMDRNSDQIAGLIQTWLAGKGLTR
jgi:pimeloyl-ACP methyl ester carboxylesterase